MPENNVGTCRQLSTQKQRPRRMGESDTRECEPARELPHVLFSTSADRHRMGTSTNQAAFLRTKETSNMLRLAGAKVTLYLASGHRIHGEIAKPFPQGFRCGSFSIWLFGDSHKIVFDRQEVVFARTYHDGTTTGKRHDAVTYDVATDENRAFMASRKVAA